jgi:DNA-binding PadR family transcriptional regulator
MNKGIRRSTIALAVLAFLWEEPMHPYRMQLLIKQRGKDEVINVRQRASLYQTIDRLLRAGLIAVKEVEREEKRPERTIYELTDAGRETLATWMREMLATPDHQFPEFPAALAYLPLLTPEDARRQLARRVQTLVAEVRGWTRTHTPAHPAASWGEYLRAVRHAELIWVRSLVEDLDAGHLTWDEAWLRTIAEQLEGAQRGKGAGK